MSGGRLTNRQLRKAVGIIQEEQARREAELPRTLPTLAEYGLDSAIVARIEADAANGWSFAHISDQFFKSTGCLGMAIAVIVTPFLIVPAAIILPVYALLTNLYKAALPSSLAAQKDAYAKYKVALDAYNRWQARLAAQAAERVARLRQQYWEAMDGTTFELEVARLLRECGHAVRRVGGAGDGGVDLWLDEVAIIQCKAHASSVSPATVRELLGTRLSAKADRAILVSTRGFTTGARDFAETHGIELWDSAHLVALQRKVPQNGHGGA